MKKRRFLLYNYMLTLFLILFVIGLTIYYVSSEHNVYYWDYNGYWRLWQDTTLQILQNPLEGFSHIFASINSNDYNVLPIVIPTIFSGLPFSSRMSYILSIVTLYFMPVIFLFANICFHFITNYEKKFSNLAISTILPAMFAAFWIPTLAGYPDICGLIFVLLALVYQFKLDLGNRIQIKKMIILGILLWSPFLLRRWYAYTIISLYCSLPLLNYFLYFDKSCIWKRFKTIYINFLISAMSTCLFALAFQNGLIIRIFKTDYADLYAAYQGGLSSSINSLFNSCGYYMLPMVFLGACIGLLTKNIKQKSFILFCIFNLVFTFFLFTRTQTPGEQHNLPFALWMLFIACYGIIWLNNLVSNQLYSSTLIIVIITCLGYIDQKVLFDQHTYTVLQEKLLPLKHLPLRVEHYQAYLNLTKDIEQLLGSTKTITVLSSNYVLNDDMLNTLSNRQLNDQIISTSQVDTRDKISISSFITDYILVVDPPQTHLGEVNQRVITIPVNSLIHHTNIGQAYTVVGHGYKLDNNATAWIYKKQRVFTSSEVSDFFAQYDQYYPQWKNIYNLTILNSILTANIVKGDQSGNFSINNFTFAISARPGDNSPTVVEWSLKDIPKLKIQSKNKRCSQRNVIKIIISGDRAPTKELTLSYGEKVIVDMKPWQKISTKMTIENIKNSGCDFLTISAL
ncbi:unnamed protein product [Commensalibacter communis]|uniref:hypothetical protein n=1 Tax=Commensalibacter communis TaxID=2972786 RepID=UPI0022FF7BCA|nr:hypothetical protein [Commensalibacter communis]CAI3930763.1 unnamed protein product [Commensalibacter communis]